MRKSDSITDVAAAFSGGYDGQPSELGLSWECDGARYHVWLDPAPPHEIILRAVGRPRPTLYKNPLRGINAGEPGYFQTRYLDISGKKNAAMIAAARAQVDFGKALEEYRDREREKDEMRRREGEARAFTERLNESAPELLKHAKAVCDALDNKNVNGKAMTPYEASYTLRAVIAKIEAK